MAHWNRQKAIPIARLGPKYQHLCGLLSYWPPLPPQSPPALPLHQYLHPHLFSPWGGTSSCLRCAGRGPLEKLQYGRLRRRRRLSGGCNHSLPLQAGSSWVSRYRAMAAVLESGGTAAGFLLTLPIIVLRGSFAGWLAACSPCT